MANWYEKELVVYKIDNNINAKVYIGQTNNADLRWSQHKHTAVHNPNSQVISRAMHKYGIENFSFEPIAGAKTREDLNLLEEELMVQYDSRNPEKGYNVDTGGGVYPRPPEVLKKISESLKKHYETHEGSWTGKKHTEESKRKISESSMGKPGTNKGKTFSEEWTGNMSVALSGKERKSKRRFTEEQEKEICRQYVEDEESIYKLAKKFEVYRSLIISILDRNGIERRQSNYTGHSNGCNVFTKEQELDICNDWQNTKMSRKTLAEKYKCGKTTIRDILLRNKMDLKRK